MIGAFITIVVGLLLTPMVGEYVATAKADNNTSEYATLLALIPFMWIIAIIAIAVGLGVSAFKEGD